MVNWNVPDLGQRAAQMPTLLDEITKQTAQRAAISRATREEDVAQRTQAAYRMLEGMPDEQPTGGYGALFGQRAASSPFRTQEDAAAFLRATDPEGMSKRQQDVGEFMANQALPRLGAVTDPAQRVSVLREMAATGPAILNTVVSKIAADGVITDEEMAQAQAMYESYRKAPAASELPWTVAGSNIVNRQTGEFRSPTGTAAQGYDFTGTGANLEAAYRALEDDNAPASVKKAAAAIVRDAERTGQSSGGGRRTQIRNIGGTDVLIDLDSGNVIRQIGPSGSGGGGISIEEGEDGTMRVQIGGKAPSTIVSEAARVSRVISEATPDLREYASLLNAGVPSYSAGIVGNAVATVTGIGSQVGVNDAIRRAARAVGQNPTPITESKRMQIRVLADRLRNSIGPIITSSLKGAPSNKDMQRAEEAIGLLQTSGSVEEAQLRLALIWRGLQAAQKWSNTVIQTGGVPVSEDLGDMPTGRTQPRPVVPPGGAPRPNRARDLLNRMRQGG